MNEKIADRLGVGALLRLEKSPETMVLLPLLAEDYGKIERALGYEAALVPGMWGLIGGGVKPGEGVVRAMWREVGEERGLVPKQNQLARLPFTIPVEQTRKGESVCFTVVPYVYGLSYDDMSRISESVWPRYIGAAQIAHLLNGGRECLRPFAWAFHQEMINTRY